MNALVIFQRDNAHWAAGILDPNCRHVLCAIRDPRTNMWLTHDLTRSGLQVTIACDGSYDLRSHYEAQGNEVYVVEYHPEEISYAPLLINSCVGYTKAFLGIRHWSLTPRQLRTHVRKIQIGEVPCVDYALT